LHAEVIAQTPDIDELTQSGRREKAERKNVERKMSKKQKDKLLTDDC
jgi:hypothetical protein